MMERQKGKAPPRLRLWLRRDRKAQRQKGLSCVAVGEEGRKEITMGKDLAGAIEVMAYGYNVVVLINGVDIGIKGGKSESKRLFGTDHSMVSELPEEMKNLACLKVGANEIRVDYQGLQDVDSTGMTIELRSTEQFGTDECRFHFREEPDENYESKSITESFDM